MEKRKLNISMMLKLPIDLEIEVLGVPPTNNHEVEDKKVTQKVLTFIGESQPEVIVNRGSLGDLDEDSQALVNQLVGQLQQTSRIFSTFPSTQDEQDKLLVYASTMCSHEFKSTPETCSRYPSPKIRHRHKVPNLPKFRHLGR